jgi:glutaminyl-tRNA synthetase
MNEEKIEIFNHIERIVDEDLKNGTCNRTICTRFPPEPNGYLNIGSAYAINMNFMIAQKFNGKFNLRFDDTNPLKEDSEYVNAIIEDINWLGFSRSSDILWFRLCKRNI